MMNVLILDDEKEIADLVEVYLKMKIIIYINFTIQMMQ